MKTVADTLGVARSNLVMQAAPEAADSAAVAVRNRMQRYGPRSRS